MPVKKAERLGTGFTSREQERRHEDQIRQETGESALGSGYTEFKRKNDAEEATERKRIKLVEQRIRPKDMKYFILAPTFQGWKFDYIFTTREDRGTGYFWDGMDSLKKLKGIEIPIVQKESSASGDQMENESKSEEGPNQQSERKKKKKKKKGPKIIDDPNHPLNQVAAAIERRQQALARPTIALPVGWDSAKDPTSGKVYYFNRSSGQQQWEPPASAAVLDLPEGWKTAKDPNTGKDYFFNDKGETLWERPTK